MYLVPVLTELTEGLLREQKTKLKSLVLKSDGTKKNVNVGDYVAELLIDKADGRKIRSRNKLFTYSLRQMRRDRVFLVCFRYLLHSLDLFSIHFIFL